jgi:hypothetical protein
MKNFLRKIYKFSISEIVLQIKSIYFPQNMTGVADVPDERDYEDVLPKGIRCPKKKNLLKQSREDYSSQTGSPLLFLIQSLNACTAFGSGIGKTLLNLCKRGQVISFNEEVQWTHQEEEQNASRNYGCTLLGAMKILKKYAQKFPIAEYRRIKKSGVMPVKKRIATGSPIFTGVSWQKTEDGKSNSYKETLKTGIWNSYKTGSLGGHFVIIFGYDDNQQCFFAVESMWKQWGENEKGVFKIPYSEIDNTMSKYVVFDQIDE